MAHVRTHWHTDHVSHAPASQSLPHWWRHCLSRVGLGWEKGALEWKTESCYERWNNSAKSDGMKGKRLLIHSHCWLAGKTGSTNWVHTKSGSIRWRNQNIWATPTISHLRKPWGGKNGWKIAASWVWETELKCEELLPRERDLITSRRCVLSEWTGLLLTSRWYRFIHN